MNHDDYQAQLQTLQERVAVLEASLTYQRRLTAAAEERALLADERAADAWRLVAWWPCGRASTRSHA